MGWRTGLRLRHAEVHVTRCPHRRDYNEGKYASPTAYGKDIAAACSSFMHAKVIRAFSHDGNVRPAEERAALVEEMFQRLAEKVARRPGDFGIDNVMTILVIEKEIGGDEPSPK